MSHSDQSPVDIWSTRRYNL